MLASTPGPHPLDANVTAKDVSRPCCVSPGRRVATPLRGDPYFSLWVLSHPTCTAVLVWVNEECGLGARCQWGDAPRPSLRHKAADVAPAGAAPDLTPPRRGPTLGSPRGSRAVGAAGKAVCWTRKVSPHIPRTAVAGAGRRPRAPKWLRCAFVSPPLPFSHAPVLPMVIKPFGGKQTSPIPLCWEPIRPSRHLPAC